MQITNRSSRRAALVLALVSTLGCGQLISAGPRGSVEVSLVNNADQPIHLMSDGESFGDDNRVPPGAARSVFVRDVEDGASVRFRAGRNGQVLATASCALVRERVDPSVGLRTVIYSEPNGFSSLACANWS